MTKDDKTELYLAPPFTHDCFFPHSRKEKERGKGLTDEMRPSKDKGSNNQQEVVRTKHTDRMVRQSSVLPFYFPMAVSLTTLTTSLLVS